MKNNNTNKRQNTPNRGPQKENPARRADYFERRFMTDEEHEAFRKHLIDSGTVKVNEPPTYLTKEQTDELRAKMIANGTLIPKAQRAARGSRFLK